ncbi:MAG: hypothetical protein CMF27_01050 [Kiritimatiellaceae bacterium]|jgi:RNA polymerase sigma factor (sigma-70 family)|nr:hypothetical protein [Kiritimatiellaceae bacterium]|tara:strand:- start:364 stop:969 length:606 start_codon:yes stop_codon:yes gene_type:complete
MKSCNQDVYMTRDTLLHRVQEQFDEMAWHDFIAQYQGYIYTIINRMNIRATDVDDLYQKILIKLWKKMPELDLEKMNRFRSYLAAVVRNCVHDYFRTMMRENRREEAFIEHESSMGARVSQPDIDRVIKLEWHNHVAAEAFKNVSIYFSEQAIDVFKRSLTEDIKEIAADFDIPLSTAYRLRSRVKASLLKEISALNTYLS